MIDTPVFPVQDIFCLIGTDPADYGWAPRTAMGPQTDGLVHMDNAYVRGAQRAYVHRSHSGPFGEVNSEDGLQNLRRFLFGRWGDLGDSRGCRTRAEPPVFLATGHAAIDSRAVRRHERAAGRALVPDHGHRPGGQPDPLAQPGGVPLAGTFVLDPRDQEFQLRQTGGWAHPHPAPVQGPGDGQGLRLQQYHRAGPVLARLADRGRRAEREDGHAEVLCRLGMPGSPVGT